MSHTTQGTLLLSKLGIAFDLHPYEYDPEAPRIGLHAAESLGIDPSQTFKTLMAEVDGKPVCVVIPSDAEASMKKLAATFGGKAAAMMKVPDAERLTGYKVGGIGPFGQKRKVPTALDETAELFDRIYINAGQRGLLLSIAPADAARAAEMIVADLTA
jgi:Cys-tRNA(Pro)/Cys-tRNA(Cys) deacylase